MRGVRVYVCVCVRAREEREKGKEGLEAGRDDALLLGTAGGGGRTGLGGVH